MISAVDTEGNYALAPFSVPVCTGREIFIAELGGCDKPVKFAESTPTALGVNLGGSLAQTFKATDRDQQALTYSLKGAKPAMTIDSTTGKFSWTPTAADVDATTKIGSANFTVIATATDGSQASLNSLIAYVCGAPKVWKPDLFACSDP